MINEDESDLRDEETQVSDHDCGGEDSHLEAYYEAQTELPDEPQDQGWPGDGGGSDDLADYNANEADDYRDE